jgi:hypothetical protein
MLLLLAVISDIAEAPVYLLSDDVNLIDTGNFARLFPQQL